MEKMVTTNYIFKVLNMIPYDMELNLAPVILLDNWTWMLVTRLILVEGTKTLSFLQNTHQPCNDVKKNLSIAIVF